MKWSRVAVVAGPLALIGLGASVARAAARRFRPRRSSTRGASFSRPRPASRSSSIRPTCTRPISRCRRPSRPGPTSRTIRTRSTWPSSRSARRRSPRPRPQALKSQQDTEAAKRELMNVTASQLQNARGQLDQTKQALNKTQEQLQSEQQLSAAQKQQLADLEAKLKDARDTIAKIAAVKDDDRGMVITLQGEVLFKTGKWDLKAGAMAKLDQIADALKGKEQPIVVYGFTDNVGAIDMNMDLSQKRAQSVRDYLVTKGIPQDLITAQGKGPADPISDNGSVEGRAANRRVELVVSPKKS